MARPPGADPLPAATTRRLRRAALVLAVCTAVALLLTALDRGSFGTKMVYSLIIGACCWGLIEGLRLALAKAASALRHARGLPDPRPVRLGFVATLPAVVAAALIGVPLGMGVADFVTGQRSPSLLAFDSAPTRFTLIVSVLASLAVTGISVTMERLAEARLAAEAAQRASAEQQLRLLQAQLEPHMLFNTLANLRVLIGIDAPQAQRMLDRLIAFLRTTLAASRHGSHALATEFGHLRDYLDLMAMRMGPRLRCAFDLPPVLASAEVPALLLQPLVENAVRHGLEPKLDGGEVRVSASAQGDELVLTVRDTGVGLPPVAAPASDSGFGLEQARGRLQTLYGTAARLQLESAGDGDGGTVATVRLPLRLAQGATP